MGWLQAISGFFSAIGSIFKFGSERSKLKNAPPIVANVDAARDLKEKEKIVSAVERSETTKDLEDERKKFAED